MVFRFTLSGKNTHIFFVFFNEGFPFEIKNVKNKPIPKECQGTKRKYILVMTLSPERRRLLDPNMSGAVVIDIKYQDVFIVVFILFLWGIVLRIFFQRWGMLTLKVLVGGGFLCEKN